MSQLLPISSCKRLSNVIKIKMKKCLDESKAYSVEDIKKNTLVCYRIQFSKTNHY